MNITIEIIHAFTANNSGGCRVGIVADPGHFTATQKQHIESTVAPLDIIFLSASVIAHIKMENSSAIHGSNDHGLVAVAHYLRSFMNITDEKIMIETCEEVKPVTFKANVAYLDDGAPIMSLTEENIFRLSASLGISPADITPGLMPQVSKSERSFLLIPVKDQNVLRSINIDKTIAAKLCRSNNLDGICLFSISLSAYTDAICRTFEASNDMREQVSAFSAAHIGVFLYENNYLRRKHIVIESTVSATSSPPAFVHVNLNLVDDTIAYVSTGGQCHRSGTMEIDLEKVIENERTLFFSEAMIN